MRVNSIEYIVYNWSTNYCFSGEARYVIAIRRRAQQRSRGHQGHSQTDELHQSRVNRTINKSAHH